MSWSEQLAASLDGRATVVTTSRGAVQFSRAGRGPPVLVIHGGPGGFDFGLAYARHLHTGGCELIALSRPGYLRTPLQSGPSPQAQADLFAALLDTLQIERAAVLAVSSGAASAVHFAARHPERTVALFLDAAICLPFRPPIGRFRRATIESGFVARLSYELAMARPQLAARFTVGGVATGLSRRQKEEAIRWITSDPGRLDSLRDQFACIAPANLRRVGYQNDKANEAALDPLPFTQIEAPTLIAHGANDAIVPINHALEAAARTERSEMVVVEAGHHMLPLSRHYQPVASRQIELARG